MFDHSTALSFFTLSIYTILIPPIFYCARKHGLPGALGYGYLLVFCCIRIATSGIEACLTPFDARTATLCALLNNVSLSPLLLAVAGFLHESRASRDPGMPRRLEYLKMAAYHGFVLVSMLLLVVGFADLPKTGPPAPPTGFTKIGIAGMLICGCMLASWVFASWDLSVEENFMEAPGHGDGTRLLHAILATLALLTVRLIYAALCIFLPPSKFKTSLVPKVIMDIVAELVVVMLLVVMGVITRKIGCRRRAQVPDDIYPQDDEVVWEPKFN